MKTVTFISALLLASATVQAQPKAEGYQFTTVVNQKVTVKNQAATGYLLVLCHYLFHRSRTPASGKR